MMVKVVFFYGEGGFDAGECNDVTAEECGGGVQIRNPVETVFRRSAQRRQCLLDTE